MRLVLRCKQKQSYLDQWLGEQTAWLIKNYESIGSKIDLNYHRVSANDHLATSLKITGLDNQSDLVQAVRMIERIRGIADGLQPGTVIKMEG